MANGNRCFVGRDEELSALTDRLGRALAGEGGVVAVVGEAGIGKTTLVEIVAQTAADRGAAVVRGRCIETDFAAPFAPWDAIIADAARAIGTERLARALGSHAPALVRLAPDIAAALADPMAAHALAGPDERVRLIGAIVALATQAPVPLVILIEDLHWADHTALVLLEHAAQAVARSPTVILVTYREPLASSRLLGTEGLLRQAGRFTYLQLRGLLESEVAALAKSVAGRAVSPEVARAIASETAGNPLYVRELVKQLIQESMLETSDLPLAGAGVPVGIRAVVARRLSRLSAEAVRLLSVAAAFSGPFALTWLAVGLDLDEDATLDAVDEAVAAGFLHPRPGAHEGTYTLSHALIRRAILDGVNPDRRIRMHRKVAVALARIGADAAEIAAQFHASRSLPGAGAGLPFALAAIAAARAARAYERATVLAELAVDLVSGAGSSPEADALAALATARAEALQLDAAPDTTRKAADALVASGREDNAACLLEAVASLLAGAGAAEFAWRGLVERGLALRATPPLVRARLKLLDQRYQMVSAGPLYIGRWLGFDPEAVATAQASSDEPSFVATLSAYAWRSRAETDALLAKARAMSQPAAILATLDVAARDLLHRHADYRGARTVLEEMLWTAERFGSVAGQAEAYYGLAKCCAILGELVEARAAAARVPELTARLGPLHRLKTMSKTALTFEIGYLGGADWTPIAEAAEAFIRTPATAFTALGIVNAAFAGLAWTLAGEPSRAAPILQSLPPVFNRMDRRDYMHAGGIDICAAALWELRATTDAPRWLALSLAIDPAAGTAPIGGTELTRARLASLAGDARRAESEFAMARKVFEHRGYVGARAIVDYDEALHLWDRDRQRARGLARSAAERFAALGMAPWQEKAARLLVTSRAHGLTARELEVIRLLASGASNKEIARSLALSVATVTRHIANIYPKIGAHGRADATRYAVEQGLFSSRT